MCDTDLSSFLEQETISWNNYLFFPCILWGEITLTENVFSYLKFAGTVLCYAAANIVLDSRVAILWYNHVCTVAHQHCVSVSPPVCSCKPFYPRILYSWYISFSKQNQVCCYQKMGDIGYVHRQRHYCPMNSVCFLLWVQHDIYQEYLWREKVKFSVMVLVGVPWEGSFLGLWAAPSICGWGQPSKWYLTHDLERWERFIYVFKSKDNDGPGKKQRQYLLLAPTDLYYASLSASMVIVFLGCGFTPCEKSQVLTDRRQSTGKEIQSAMFRCV